jgi:hypothetical protein
LITEEGGIDVARDKANEFVCYDLTLKLLQSIEPVTATSFVGNVMF